MSVGPQDVLDFWFKETPPEQWFVQNPVLDEEIRQRFGESWEAGADGRLNWPRTSEGALALIVLLDQFPRNMFRVDGRAYATDALARDIARDAVSKDLDMQVPESKRSFFYLPFMHSEDLEDQNECLHLTKERLGEDHFSFAFAVRHHDTIARFGRFPARNDALGRESTDDEVAFLASHPGGF